MTRYQKSWSRFGVGEDITEEVVEGAINQLKNGKAEGITGIVSEMVKTGGDTVVAWIWRVCVGRRRTAVVCLMIGRRQ